jgi:hypothetical protein
MLPVYAQIKNPLIIGRSGKQIDPAAEALINLGMDEASAIKLVEKAFEEKGNIGKQIQSRAQAQGYDGIMQYRGDDLSEVVSYNPNAVKSAIGNQGTYDIYSPDLSKADGGKVVKGIMGALSKLNEMARSKRIAPQSLPIKETQEKALKLAQERAALPPSKGGLGLPAGNTPQQRAAAMKFDTDAYHGTTNDFNKFAGRNPTYAAEEPRIADIYANATSRHMSLNRPVNAGPNIIPLKLGGKEFSVSDLGEGGGGWYSDNLAQALGIPRARGAVNELPNYGIDRLKVTDMGDLGGIQTQHMIPSVSDNIRSRFAAFDPFRRNAAVAAAMGVAAPDLLAQENK